MLTAAVPPSKHSGESPQSEWKRKETQERHLENDRRPLRQLQWSVGRQEGQTQNFQEMGDLASFIDSKNIS